MWQIRIPDIFCIFETLHLGSHVFLQYGYTSLLFARYVALKTGALQLSAQFMVGQVTRSHLFRHKEGGPLSKFLTFSRERIISLYFHYILCFGKIISEFAFCVLSLYI